MFSVILSFISQAKHQISSVSHENDQRGLEELLLGPGIQVTVTIKVKVSIIRFYCMDLILLTHFVHAQSGATVTRIGQKEIVSLLLARGADVNLPTNRLFNNNHNVERTMAALHKVAMR